MGGAAALQVSFDVIRQDESWIQTITQILKKFTSGGGGGGGSKTQLISLAMAEASKLFDKAGGAASGNKQDAINGAAMTVTKLLVQSKFGSGLGGGDSGGVGGLMGLVGLFYLCAMMTNDDHDVLLGFEIYVRNYNPNKQMEFVLARKPRIT